MQHTKWLAGILLLAGFPSCKSALNDAESPVAKSKITDQFLASADSVSFIDNISQLNSVSRKLVRHVEFDARTNDISTTVSALENAVKSLGGIVASSETIKDFIRSTELPYHADSIKKVSVYQARADLVLRVPIASLDSVLRSIPNVVSFIHHRSLTQEDKTMVYLSNSLKNQGSNHSIAEAKKLAKKTEDIVNADAYAAAKETEQIDRTISNISMLDEVNYATVHLKLTEPERVDELILYDANTAMQAPYGQKIAASLSAGLSVISELFLFLLKLWPFCLVVVVVMVILKNTRKIPAFKFSNKP